MTDETIQAAERVVEENKSGWIEDYWDGDDGAMNFAVGQVMEKTGGRAHPTEARQFLLQELRDD